ncbi:hypothetical protein QKL74_12565 [Acinetobacter bereziniae]|nr:hypothetical protein [Acinetobacter bereziniae]MDP6002131.1 hypothetical protein [Acinetobacter bereziniae]
MDHQSSTTPHALILGLTLEQAISVLAKKPVDASKRPLNTPSEFIL